MEIVHSFAPRPHKRNPKNGISSGVGYSGGVRIGYIPKGPLVPGR